MVQLNAAKAERYGDKPMCTLKSTLLGPALTLVVTLPATMVPEDVRAASFYESGGPSGEAMLMDGVLVRPLGIGATLVGSVVYVITLPFSALGGNADVAAQKLIKEPAAFTFTRPLGEF